MEEHCERMKKEVERELARRKSLGSQLRTLLDSQLQVYFVKEEIQNSTKASEKKKKHILKHKK